MAKSTNLEESFEQLDSLIDRLENGNLTMNEAFKLYKEGVSLVKSCNAQLDKVEKQLVVLNAGADEAFESGDDINTEEDDK
jgi:exodeoxyribonuclease VII small subunit